MLKISVCRRLRAISPLRRDQAKFETRCTNAQQVAGLQGRRPIDTMTVEKGPVTTVIGNDALVVLAAQHAVSSRHARHILLQINPALAIGLL